MLGKAPRGGQAALAKLLRPDQNLYDTPNIGGAHELITDPGQLSVLAQAGVFSQLDSLYAAPEATA
jgi:hypothetical protein